MEVDDALALLGRFGKWQVAVYSLCCTSAFVTVCWQMLAFVFVGWTPPHHCALPPGANFSQAIPVEMKDGVATPSQCLMYQYNTTSHGHPPSFSNHTMACDNGWTYDLEFPDQSTLVTDLDLVCDRAVLAETTQTVFVVGIMVGSIVFSVLSDKYGRKTVHLACIWTVGLVGSLITLSREYYTFVALRFILGFLQVGMVGPGVILAIEVFPKEQRTFAGTFIQVFWVAAHFLLTLLAYLLHSWRHLQIIISLAGFLTISYIWLIPESVPWLAANGRKDKAEEILQRAAKVNKVTFPSPVLKHSLGESNSDGHGTSKGSLHNRKEGIKGVLRGLFWCCDTKAKEARKYQYSIWDIFRHPRLRWNVLNMCFQWLVANTVYYGLLLSTNELAGSRYLNFFISGAVELPAYLLCVFVLHKGRRIPLVVFNLVAGLSLGILIFIPAKTASGIDLSPLIITFTNIGKFAITATFCIVVLYVSEIAPTNLRNIASGLASSTGRLGGVLAPFSSYAGRQIAWLPNAVFGILGLLAAFLALFLPETVDKPLPQTLEDIDAWYDNSKNNSTTDKHEIAMKDDTKHTHSEDRITTV